MTTPGMRSSPCEMDGNTTTRNSDKMTVRIGWLTTQSFATATVGQPNNGTMIIEFHADGRGQGRAQMGVGPQKSHNQSPVTEIPATNAHANANHCSNATVK